MESLTINSIQRIQKLIDQMKSEGIDPLFIMSALAQVMADLEADVQESVNDG